VTTTSTPKAVVSTQGGNAGGLAMVPECKAANLKLSLSGFVDGAAGHATQALRFTNVSNVACLVMGFPGVSYVTGHNGQQVGPAAAREGRIGPGVLLAQGQMASSLITMTDVGVFDAGVCTPTPVRGFRVYAPDDTTAMYIDRPSTGCAGDPPSPQLRVQAFESGPGNP